MALDPLFTPTDLSARSIDTPDGMNAETIIDSVSEAIRTAAGCAISQLTSTIELPSLERTDQLKLPAGPVTAVASVAINGNALVEGVNYVRVGDSLYRIDGYVWADSVTPGAYWRPCSVDVTYTHGYQDVPADIVDLGCSLVGAAFAQGADDTYGLRLPQVEKLGDYEIDYRQTRSASTASNDSPSPVAIPPLTAAWLRQRFLGSAFIVSMR